MYFYLSLYGSTPHELTIVSLCVLIDGKIKVDYKLFTFKFKRAIHGFVIKGILRT